MHILITGGNGYIGSHLVDRLAQTGQHKIFVMDLFPRPYEPMPEDVTFISGNLGDISLVRRTLIDHGIDIVYHLAWATIHETSLINPVVDVEQNLVPMVNLLNLCREARVNHVVFISSGGAVYGIPGKIPVEEEHPTNPINPYGVTKLAAEKYLKMFQHLYGLEYTVFRPSVPYGPRQNPRRRQGAIAVFIYKILRGEPIQVWGDGETLRDYFYVRDLAEALASVLNHSSARNNVINLAGTRAYSLNELIRLIEDALGLSATVEYQEPRKFDVQKLKLGIDKAKEVLNWTPTTALPDGIRYTAEWIQKWID